MSFLFSELSVVSGALSHHAGPDIWGKDHGP